MIRRFLTLKTIERYTDRFNGFLLLNYREIYGRLGDFMPKNYRKMYEPFLTV